VRRRAVVVELLGAEARDAEIQDLHAAVLREKDVLRLDVAVDDPARVRGGEDVEQAVGDLHRLLDGHAAAEATRARVGGLALEELHDEERGAVLGLVVVEHAHDARMVHGVRDVPFAREAGADVAQHRELRVQHLERDAAPVAVGRRIHGAHAADAEEAIDLPLPADARPHASLGDVAHAGMDLRHDARRSG